MRDPVLSTGNRRALDRLGAFFWAVTVGKFAYAEELFGHCDLTVLYEDIPPFRDFPRSFRERKRPPTSESVYFVQAGARGAIKIGQSSDPVRRISALFTQSPERLHFLGAMPGDAKTEARLHRRFAGLRMHGEWFRPGDVLLDYIRRYARAA